MSDTVTHRKLCDAYDLVKADETLSAIEKITAEAYLMGALGGLLGEDMSKVKKSIERMINKKVNF